MTVSRFVTHSHKVAGIAVRHGWLPGARYTNLRDIRRFDRIGFLDIEWRDYDFSRHLRAAAATAPMVTVARDILRCADLARVIDEAYELARFSQTVVIVPKARRLANAMEELVPSQFIFGFSV